MATTDSILSQGETISTFVQNIKLKKLQGKEFNLLQREGNCSFDLVYVLIIYKLSLIIMITPIFKRQALTLDIHLDPISDLY